MERQLNEKQVEVNGSLANRCRHKLASASIPARKSIDRVATRIHMYGVNWIIGNERVGLLAGMVWGMVVDALLYRLYFSLREKIAYCAA